VALIMATGGSTNAVLHYLAIAHAAEVEWTLDDFERMRRKVPVICDLKPSGNTWPWTCIRPAGCRRC
jgi:dihydroxy-acid dehydratase